MLERVLNPILESVVNAIHICGEYHATFRQLSNFLWNLSDSIFLLKVLFVLTIFSRRHLFSSMISILPHIYGESNITPRMLINIFVICRIFSNIPKLFLIWSRFSGKNLQKIILLSLDNILTTGQIYVHGIFLEHSHDIFLEYSEKVPYAIPGNISK